MKYIMALIFTICFVSTVTAVTIKMLPDEKHGVNIPKYQLSNEDERIDNAKLILVTLVDPENFPFSSRKQGSIFYKMINDIEQYTKIKIEFLYKKQNLDELTLNFERGQAQEFNSLFGVYYKELPYSRNEYVYPALMTNNIHLITSVQNKLDIKKKEDLKKFKGVHVVSDKVSDLVARDIASMKIQKVDSFDQAYEELLTGKVDYIVASYYPSLFAAYTLGIKKYIAYSKEPIWKMPMFIRYHASLKKKNELKVLSEYLKSTHYKNLREQLFQELVDMYKENTSGVVPPTYIKFTEEENTPQSNEAEQTLEN